MKRYFGTANELTFIYCSEFDGLTYMIVEGAARSLQKCLEITKKMIIFAGEIYLS